MKLVDLKNKTIFITGSDKGLGKIFIEYFAKNKSEIISCARKKTKEHQIFCKSLSHQYNIKIHNYYFDLENENEILKNLKLIINHFSKIDVLINNAGSNFTSLIEMTSFKNLKKIHNINFYSIFIITQKLLRLLKKSSQASIVNISSSASIENNIGRFAYSSSKVMLNSFTKTLSKEVGRYKIRVNAIAPGLTDTKMMNLSTTKKNIENTISRVSLNRIGTPEEIANLVLFLSSNLSSYINGQVISIDGGLNEGI